MHSGFDINKIQGDGYLVIPLSMARLATGQSPEETYKVFHYFSKKLVAYTNDVILLYTSGLYFNDKDITYEKRIKINEQMINHSLALRKLIQKRKEFIPGAFHFLPIDYIILNCKDFRLFFNKLKKLIKEDNKFKRCVQKDMGKREYNEANENFILEEVAVAHIIRERLVEFPRTLVKNDIWRLIAYPGTYMESDNYQWKNKILLQTDTINPYRASQYDFKKKKLFVFSDL